MRIGHNALLEFVDLLIVLPRPAAPWRQGAPLDPSRHLLPSSRVDHRVHSPGFTALQVVDVPPLAWRLPRASASAASTVTAMDAPDGPVTCYNHNLRGSKGVGKGESETGLWARLRVDLRVGLTVDGGNGECDKSASLTGNALRRGKGTAFGEECVSEVAIVSSQREESECGWGRTLARTRQSFLSIQRGEASVKSLSPRQAWRANILKRSKAELACGFSRRHRTQAGSVRSLAERQS